MFNCLRINETVASIAAGYRPESSFLAEAEKLGKPVDEHKWNKAKDIAEKEIGKRTGDKFYAYTMGVYKKMMGEEVITEAEGKFKKTSEYITKDGQHAYRAGRNADYGTWDHRHYVKKGNGWEHVKDHGYDGHETKEDADAAAKGDCEMHDKKSVKESEEVEDKTKKADTEHDETKETKEDPTREKLETAKDEEDEKKGGPAELAADLRVSVRIEKMNLGRYRRMITKHELSASDEKWLKRRIEELEKCVEEMEKKIPDLESASKSGKGEIKEQLAKGIRDAIVSLIRG